MFVWVYKRSQPKKKKEKRKKKKCFIVDVALFLICPDSKKMFVCFSFFYFYVFL